MNEPGLVGANTHQKGWCNLRRNAFTLVLAIGIVGLTATLTSAQPTGGGGTGGGIIGIPGMTELAIPDMTAVSGTVVDIPINIVGDDPVFDAMMVISTDASQLQVLDLTLSEGLEQYIDDGGDLPTCDIIVEATGDGAFLFMFMQPAYDPTIYGEEYMVLSVSINAPAGTTAEINYSASTGEEVATITVSGDSEPPFMRGDTNNDSNCDITDAVKLLDILFQGAENNCHDAADIDDNGSLEVTDAVLLLAALFQSGPGVDETCGSDPTADTLPDCLATACP